MRAPSCPRWATAASEPCAPPMHAAKAGPDTGLCGGRLELGRHLAQKLISVAVIDRCRQAEQQVHFFGGETERRGHGCFQRARRADHRPNRRAVGEELARRQGVRHTCKASRARSSSARWRWHVTTESLARWPEHSNRSGHFSPPTLKVNGKLAGRGEVGAGAPRA